MNELESQDCRDSDRVGDGEACKRSPFVARLAFTGVFVSFGPFQPPPEAARELRSPKLMKPTPDFNLHTQMEALLMRSREIQAQNTHKSENQNQEPRQRVKFREARRRCFWPPGDPGPSNVRPGR
ncbi:hypothetical protein Trihar35433_235 [Trichoderma harzianum]|nr:hypothetical protein Trihar35433_235 [Trichoderma harzianum]